MMLPGMPTQPPSIRQIDGDNITVTIIAYANARNARGHGIRKRELINREEIMENAQRCRAIALLCRQQASLHPDQNWKWLAQAERWEHLAEASFVLKAEMPPQSGGQPAAA